MTSRELNIECGAIQILITGWLTSLSWKAVLATGGILVGTMIQGLIILDNPNDKEKSWHGTLLAWTVITVAIFVNTVVAGLLPFLEGFILVLHIIGFIAVMVSLLYLSPKGGANNVFFRTLNEGDWPTQGVLLCIGFISNVATFVGTRKADLHFFGFFGGFFLGSTQQTRES